MSKETKKSISADSLSIEEVQAEHSRLRYRFRFRRTLLSTVAVLLVAAALAALVATLWLPVLRIYGTSMTPTLQEGQIIATVRTDNFDTGDVVAFYYGSKILVKRCIAAPGDWVSIDEDGNITVNNELLDEPYIINKSLGTCDIEFPYQVPDDHWFLVGDNRVDSVDSRSTQVGSIAGDMILGKVIFRVWPLSDFGQIR